MNPIKSMLLDLRCAKSQLKSFWFLLIFSLVLINLGINTKSVSAVLIMLYMMAFMISAMIPTMIFPSFDNFRTMYLAFPQKKSDIVCGRYLLFLTGGTISLLFCISVTLIISIFTASTGGMAVAICAFAFVFAMLPSIQTPVFFCFGFVKSRVFFYFSIFGLLGLVWLVFTKNFSNDQMDVFMSGKTVITNEPLLCIVFLLAALLCLVISYFISLTLFTKKDI